MYDRILVPLDGSATSEAGVLEAIRLAQGQPGTRLVLLHVMNDFPSMMEMAGVADFEELRAHLRRWGEALLAKAAKLAADAGVACESRMREIHGGRIADAVLEEAREGRCDLVVMGTHGRRGLRRLALGSDAEQVVRGADVPVMLVRTAEHGAPARADVATAMPL